MVDLGGKFTPETDAEPRKERGPILPAGWYAMQVVATEKKTSKSNELSSYLSVELEVMEDRHPEQKGSKVWDVINLWNVSKQAREIAGSEFRDLCEAAGFASITDTEELHNKPIAVKLAVQAAQGSYPESNNVKKYDPIASRFNGGAAPAVSQPASGGGEPAAGATGETPPWIKSK